MDKTIEAFNRFFESVLQYLTNILSFILIIAVGLVLGHLLKVLSNKFFKLIKVDAHSERSEVTEMLNRGGITEPISSLLSKAVGWITVFVFFIIALGALEVPKVETLLGEFFVYVPNILVAIVVVFLGYMLSNFVGRTVLIACVNAGMKSSGLISKLARAGVLILTASMALEQLGIGRETTVMAFTIIFGGVVLTLSLAFGLGGKDIAREYLESKCKRPEEGVKEQKEDEISHL